MGFGQTPLGFTNSLLQSKVLRGYEICGSVKLGPRACEHWAAEGAPRSPLPRPQIFPNRAHFFYKTGHQKPPHLPGPFFVPDVLFPKEIYSSVQFQDRIPVPFLVPKSIQKCAPPETNILWTRRLDQLARGRSFARPRLLLLGGLVPEDAALLARASFPDEFLSAPPAKRERLDSVQI